MICSIVSRNFRPLRLNYESRISRIRSGVKMFRQSIKILGLPLLSGILASSVAPSAAFGQSNPEQANPAGTQAPRTLRAASSPAASPSNSPSSAFGLHRSRREENFYAGFWGVDNLEVKATAQGSLIRFNYRVVDKYRAKSFGDKSTPAYLIDERTGAVLQVPTMPKVGMLRQAGDLENGREYWIAFSNKGAIKPGNRVDIVIGNFRANGLIVR